MRVAVLIRDDLATFALARLGLRDGMNTVGNGSQFDDHPQSERTLCVGKPT
jgi:hypothetical protein